MLIHILIANLFLCSVTLERPHLTLAQGYVESRFNKNAVGARGEKGGWQVNERIWGKVPKQLHKQAEQAEKILNDLIDNTDADTLYSGLCRYGGSSVKPCAYADKVRLKALELAILIT